MTITSNIHPNLSAWANGTFALGNRVSNAGNAYQCITAGSSTGAPTGTGGNINNGGAAHWKWLSAVDFTSLQAWWNSLPATLTDNVVSLSWNNGTVTCPASTFFFDGQGVTAGSFSVTIGCAPGESFRDTAGALAFNTANGVSFTAPATGTTNLYWFLQCDNVIIDGWQLKNPNSTSGAIMLCGSSGNAGLALRNCLLDGFPQLASASPFVYAPGLNATLVNTLIVDRGTAYRFVDWDTTASGSAVNCTAVAVNGNSSAAFFSQGSANQVKVRNCALFGYTTPVFSQNAVGSAVMDHCCTDVAAASIAAPAAGFGVTDNGGEQFSKTAANQFVSATTDFRLKAGSDCLNNGTTDTTDIPTADDIFRTHRPQGNNWDIGAFELITVLPHNLAMAMQPMLAS
jgi:hypothetical protein